MKKLFFSVFLLIGFASSSMLVGQVAPKLAKFAKVDSDFNNYEDVKSQLNTVKAQIQSEVEGTTSGTAAHKASLLELNVYEGFISQVESGRTVASSYNDVMLSYRSDIKGNPAADPRQVLTRFNNIVLK